LRSICWRCNNYFEGDKYNIIVELRKTTNEDKLDYWTTIYHQLSKKITVPRCKSCCEEMGRWTRGAVGCCLTSLVFFVSLLLSLIYIGDLSQPSGGEPKEPNNEYVLAFLIVLIALIIISILVNRVYQAYSNRPIKISKTNYYDYPAIKNMLSDGWYVKNTKGKNATPPSPFKTQS
jgi:hypothetical protein